MNQSCEMDIFRNRIFVDALNKLIFAGKNQLFVLRMTSVLNRYFILLCKAQ